MKKPEKNRKRIVKRIILLFILFIILAAIAFYVYSMLKQEYTITYDSYTATTGSISNALSFSGNLNLVDSKTYTASSSETVRAIYVSEGDSVSEGDKLMRLSGGETIKADFDGRVNAVSVDVGDEVTAGASLIQIADFEHMQVALRVDEYDISDVSVGQSCTVTATATEKTFESEIASINYISASGGSVAYYTATAYVTVDDGVYPGMQVTVSIPQEEATDVVILKADAISFDNTNRAFVWMKNDAGDLEQVMIETGVSNGNYVEIVSGLSDGDEVYVETKQQTASAAGGLLSGLFGGQQFNATAGMPEVVSFDAGSAPDFSRGGGDFGGGFGGGGMPGGGQ